MLNIIRNMGQSLFVKIIFGAIILSFIFWGVYTGNPSGGNAVATVNGENISLRAYADQMRNELRNDQVANEIRSNTDLQDMFRQMVLSRMIAGELLSQEADRLGIVVTPQELYVNISSLPYFQGLDGKLDRERYTSTLAAQGITPGDFEAMRRMDLLRGKVLNYILSTVSVTEEETRAFFNFIREERTADYVLFPLADYRSQVAVTDRELEDYYEQNKESFRQPARISLEHVILTPETLAASYPVEESEIIAFYEANGQRFTEPARFRVRHIIMQAPTDGPDRANSKTRLEEVRKQIADGADFTATAKEVSDDRDDLPEEGEWLSKDQLIPVLSAALDNLKLGEISGVVELPEAFILFKLEERREERVKPLEEVRGEILARLAAEKVLADYKNIEARAENSLRDGKPIAAIAEEFKAPLLKTGLIPLDEVTSRLGLLQASDDTLRVVAAGRTVPTPLSVKDGIAIVHVVENIPAGIPSFADLKDTIRQTAVDDKAKALAREDAQKALASAKNNDGNLPAEFQGKLKTSERALRASPNNRLVIEPLGEASQLVGDLFSHGQGVWLPNLYDVRDGVVIARVSDIRTGTDEEWEMNKHLYADGLLIRRREMAERAFMQSLLQRAKVTQDVERMRMVPLS